jgi:hypothetical protein
MTTLIEARAALSNAKSNEVNIICFPNGNWHIEIAPCQVQTAGRKSKWAKFADEMHSPLRGQSEQVNALIKQFRNEFFRKT